MKQFSFALILLTLLALIAGCATATPTSLPPTTVSQPTNAPAPTQAAAGVCALRLATTTSTADSGLLTAILPDFERQFNCKVDVVAVGTGQALEIGSKGDADVVLVHARKSEDKFVADGHAKERFDVMYNDFIVVGPKADPAKIAGMASVVEAFQRIAETHAPFASRGDKSGTHFRELEIWTRAGITPTRTTEWYHALGQGMGETLLAAGEKGMYALTDRATYLALRDKLPKLAIVLGGNTLPANHDAALRNEYGVMAVNPDKHPGVQYDMALNFVKWILSPETQKAIGVFGADKFGQPLFYPDAKPDSKIAPHPQPLSREERGDFHAWV